MSEDLEVMSALLDGDHIDIEQLEAALEKPAARRALVDFVRLREASRAERPTPRREFYEHSRLRRVTRQKTAGVPLPYAAAVVLLAMLLGSFFNLSSLRNRAPAAPPEATRVLTFEPGVDWSPERNVP
jgi:hypothetical protein